MKNLVKELIRGLRHPGVALAVVAIFAMVFVTAMALAVTGHFPLFIVG